MGILKYVFSLMGMTQFRGEKYSIREKTYILGVESLRK